MIPIGYIRVHRRIVNDWKWKTPFSRSAWISMLLEAKWAPDSGLQRGQLLTSVREAAKRWGISKTQVSRFLHRCVKEHDISMIVVDRRTLRPNGTQDGTERGTQEGTFTRFSALLITILNYDRDQPKFNDIAGNQGTQQRADGVPVHGTSSNNNKRRCKKNTQLSVVTANSQVYNFFIETRRQALNINDWTPTAAQSKRLRTNINKLLEFRSPNVIIEWLKNYFADQKMGAEMWPWTFFMSDPVRWSRPRNGTRSMGHENEESLTILDAKKAREERLRRLESRDNPLPDEVPV